MEIRLEKLKAIQFKNFQDYFQYRLQREFLASDGLKRTNLEQFAKLLGYSSASSISMIFSGERLPSSELLDAISHHWKLSREEDQYIRNLVQLEKLRKKGRNTEQVLGKLSHFKDTYKVSLKQFSMMRDWYHIAIQSLISTFDFREDYSWISRRLRKKVSPAQVKKSIEIMTELGIVNRNADGQLEILNQTLETTHEIPSEAIRAHHKGMMNRAIEAVDEQEVRSRHFNSLTLKFDSKEMAKAKSDILQFVNEFNSEFEAEESNQIYQLNVQLFEHTKKEDHTETSNENN